jgi:hypothetical protein
VQNVREMLRRFVEGGDRSVAAARQLEDALAARFADDERFEDLLHALASYQPGGGEFLFDEERILPHCRAALALMG